MPATQPGPADLHRRPPTLRAGSAEGSCVARDDDGEAFLRPRLVLGVIVAMAKPVGAADDLECPPAVCAIHTAHADSSRWSHRPAVPSSVAPAGGICGQVACYRGHRSSVTSPAASRCHTTRVSSVCRGTSSRAVLASSTTSSADIAV